MFTCMHLHFEVGMHPCACGCSKGTSMQIQEYCTCSYINGIQASFCKLSHHCTISQICSLWTASSRAAFLRIASLQIAFFRTQRMPTVAPIVQKKQQHRHVIKMTHIVGRPLGLPH